MSVSALNAIGSASSSVGLLTGSHQLNQDDFLHLLITQLTNQDPLSPQDDKQFISQMAQFSSLESAKQMTDSMGKLQSASLIGKTVQSIQTGNGAPTIISGVVKAARFDNDGVHLLVNDTDIRLDQVTLVQN